MESRSLFYCWKGPKLICPWSDESNPHYSISFRKIRSRVFPPCVFFPNVYIRTWKYTSLYTGCNRINLPYAGRTFIRLVYVDVTKHIYTPSWTGRKIMTREKIWSFCGFMYCTCLRWFIICTLRRSVLEPIAKPSYAQANSCYVKYLNTKYEFYENSV